MYLLDTNVISELRKTKPHGAVLAWRLSVSSQQIAVPAIVIGELQQGAEITRRHDIVKALEIERWIERVLAAYAIVPMDGAAFREWARLMAGKSDELSAHAMIAATARIHHLVIATRNVIDFSSFDVPLFNPFGENPIEQKD
ncbi:MAG: type II toxin-antitoxin system VapC family toxin [Terracidiphilus sp.]